MSIDAHNQEREVHFSEGDACAVANGLRVNAGLTNLLASLFCNREKSRLERTSECSAPTMAAATLGFSFVATVPR